MADEKPTNSRSYEAFEEGQQLYRVIEFCVDPEALWGKIESGHYQWLGIHPTGKFVLGRPPIAVFTAEAVGVAIHPGTSHDHRIEFRKPGQSSPNIDQFATAEDARAAYASFAGTGPDARVKGSGLWKIRLFVDGELEAERLAVSTRPNYL